MPVAHSPFRHDGGLSGQLAVAFDDVVHVVAIDEIVVDAVLHLAPPAHVELFLRVTGIVGAESAISHGAVGFPLNLQGDTLSGLKIIGEFVAVGVPGRAPAFGHHLLAVDKDAHVAGIIHYELVFARLVSLDFSFIGHVASGEIEILGKVDHVGEVATDKVLEIDGVFALHEGCSGFVSGDVGAGQGALLPLFVIKLEYAAELLVVLGISPTAKGIAIPEDAIVVGGDYEGDGDFGVVLEKLLVLPFIVEFIALVLAEAVDALFVVEALEDLAHGVAFRALHLYGGEFAATLSLFHDESACLVVEIDVAGSEGDCGLDLRSHDRNGGIGLLHVEAHLPLVGKHHEAGIL